MSNNRWKRQLWYIYTREYYSTIKNEIISSASTFLKWSNAQSWLMMKHCSVLAYDGMGNWIWDFWCLSHESLCIITMPSIHTLYFLFGMGFWMQSLPPHGGTMDSTWGSEMVWYFSLSMSSTPFSVSLCQISTTTKK